MGQENGGALSGIRVLDLTTAGAGPKGTMQLAMLGADVLRIEPIAENQSRRVKPSQGGVSAFYTGTMLSKRSAVCDVRGLSERQREALVRWADVFVENLRRGAADRLGFSYDKCRKLNPELVYVSLSGWGERGPLATRGGVDALAQAYSGFVSYTGHADGEPIFNRAAGHIDYLAGSCAATAAILGLIGRSKTGAGTRLGTSLLESATWAQTHNIAETVITGENPRPAGSSSLHFAPDSVYRCGDGTYVAVSVRTEDEWGAFCRALDATQLLSDRRFTTNRSRVANQRVLDGEIARTMSRRVAFWWLLQFTRMGVPHSLVQNFLMMRNDPQILENEYLRSMEIDNRGRFTIAGAPWRFSRSATVVKPSRPPGADTPFLESVLALDQHRGAGVASIPQGRWLSDLRVLDATQGVCGPMAGSLYQHLGAQVWKVEPPQGDYMRNAAISTTLSGPSIAFQALNAGKRALSTPPSLDEMDVLLLDQDSVWLEWNPEDLVQRYPRLVVGRITANGVRGPRSGIRGSELTAQMQAEYFSSLGTSDAHPVRVGPDLISATTAVAAFQGTLAALFERQSSLLGQIVDISLLCSAICSRDFVWSVLGEPDEWSGHICESYTSGNLAYTAADGALFFNLGRMSQEQYYTMLDKIGLLTTALSDERFLLDGGREAGGQTGKYRDELRPIWSEALSHFTRAEAVEIIAGADGDVAPVLSLGELVKSEQFKQLGLLRMIDTKDGQVPVIAPPLGQSADVSV